MQGCFKMSESLGTKIKQRIAVTKTAQEASIHAKRFEQITRRPRQVFADVEFTY